MIGDGNQTFHPLGVLVQGSDASSLTLEQLGGKAAGLVRLRDLGVEVPAFWVVPSSVMRFHLRDPEFAAALGAASLLVADAEAERGELTEDDWQAAADVLQPALERLPLDAQLTEAIATLASSGEPFAVRSSLMGEDAPGRSFAGQLRTSLFQTGPDAVAAAIRDAWSSAFSAGALAYARGADIAPAAVRMAVVIQTMADADVSGVAFSADPISGARDRCLLTAVYGAGEGAVGDLVPADEFRWSPQHGELAASVASKSTAVRRDPTGRGTALQAVERRQDERALTPAQVAEVGALAKRLEQELGHLVDLEWCYVGDTLHALQARPITALPADPAGTGEARVFDNANIQESYNGVTTPLTFSFAARLYGAVYSELLRRLGALPATRRAFVPVAQSLLGLIDGRVYYNLNSWRHMILTLPGGNRRVEEIESVMFHTDIGAGPTAPASRRARAHRMAEVTRMTVGVAAILARQDHEVDRYVAGFETFYGSIDRARLPGRPLEELVRLARDLVDEAAVKAAPAYLNDVRVGAAGGAVRRQLAAVYPDAEVDGRLSDLLSGIDGLESVAPARELMAIAAASRAHPAILEAARAGAAGVLEAIERTAPELHERVRDYVSRYGDRAIGELKLESRTVRDDPAFLAEVLTNFIRSEELDAETSLRGEQERARAALRDLLARTPGWKRPLAERGVRLARRSVACRERLRLRRTWAFGLARDTYRAIGGKLHAAGVLGAADDVLYLTVEEIEAYVEGRSSTTRLAALAAVRREEFDAARRVDAPDRVATVGPVPLAARSADEPARGEAAEGELRGIGCCAGVVDAPVRVILDPADRRSAVDHILCTVRTDPGWAPLFPTVKGLLVERGSILSHSAVVARELGIPTVVGVPDVTRILHDGERIVLDGAAGTVRRMETGTP